MGLKLIFAGIIFFFNPNIGLFDFAPDLLGCILIISGLAKLKYTDDRFENAQKSMLWLCGAMAIKLCAFLYTTFVSNGNVMPFTFIFSVIEAILLIWFFTSFYSGLEYVCTRYSDASYTAASKSAGIFTYIFIALKSLLTFIPQSLSLFNTYDEDGRIIEEPLRYVKPYILLLCFIGVVILGICFISVNKNYLLPISKDKQIKEKLLTIYKTNYLDNIKLVNKLYFNKAMGFILAGAIFMPDLTVDGINLLPDTLGFALMTIGIFMLNKRLKSSNKNLVLPIVLTFYSIITYYFKTLVNICCNNAFAIESFFNKKYNFVENGSAVLQGSVLYAIQGVLYVITIFMICRSIRTFFQSLDSEVSMYAQGLKLKTASVFSAISGLVVYALPAATAYLYYKAEKYIDTQKYYEIMVSAEKCDLTVTAFGVILIVSNIYIIYSFYKTKKIFDLQY